MLGDLHSGDQESEELTLQICNKVPCSLFRLEFSIQVGLGTNGSFWCKDWFPKNRLIITTSTSTRNKDFNKVYISSVFDNVSLLYIANRSFPSIQIMKFDIIKICPYIAQFKGLFLTVFGIGGYSKWCIRRNNRINSSHAITQTLFLDLPDNGSHLRITNKNIKIIQRDERLLIFPVNDVMIMTLAIVNETLQIVTNAAFYFDGCE